MSEPKKAGTNISRLKTLFVFIQLAVLVILFAGNLLLLLNDYHAELLPILSVNQGTILGLGLSFVIGFMMGLRSISYYYAKREPKAVEQN